MGNRRAEMRRQNRENEKQAKKMVNQNVLPIMTAEQIKNMDAAQIAQATGAKIQTIKLWCEERVEAIWKDCIEQTNDILWQSENYMAYANVVIMLYAVEMTFGNLKTVQKGMNRLVENLYPAQQQIDKVGIKRAFERLQEKYGLDALEFDDFDINELWDYHQKELATFCSVIGRIGKNHEGKKRMGDGDKKPATGTQKGGLS